MASRPLASSAPERYLWYLRNSNSRGAADLSLSYGLAGDIPLCGDWDGDGDQTAGIYRGGTFHLRNTNTSGPADITAAYGFASDTPIVGDWDGDGMRHDRGVPPSNAGWYLKNTNASGGAGIAFSYGMGSDIPITGDWDNDGDDTPGMVRSAMWYLRNSNTSGLS